MSVLNLGLNFEKMTAIQFNDNVMLVLSKRERDIKCYRGRMRYVQSATCSSCEIKVCANTTALLTNCYASVDVTGVVMFVRSTPNVIWFQWF